MPHLPSLELDGLGRIVCPASGGRDIGPEAGQVEHPTAAGDHHVAVECRAGVDHLGHPGGLLQPGYRIPARRRFGIAGRGEDHGHGPVVGERDLDALQAKAFEVERAINQVQGATGVAPSRVQGKPYLEIQVRRELLGRYGLSVEDVFRQVEPDDLLKFGLIPEFIGRLPVLATLDDLDEKALVKILTEPKNAFVKQYQRLFDMENVGLTFTDDALSSVARKAIARKTGARGLRSILEGILLDTMYELPTWEGVEEVVVNAEVVEGRSQPLVIYSERRDKGGAA